ATDHALLRLRQHQQQAVGQRRQLQRRPTLASTHLGEGRVAALAPRSRARPRADARASQPVAIWPRISPFGFLPVIRVMKAPPVCIVWAAALLAFFTPLWPEWHCAQRRTRIGPKWRGLPWWMSAITTTGFARSL